MSSSEQQLLRVWERVSPVAAYVQGRKTAGRYFVLSGENVQQALNDLVAIKTKSLAEKKVIEALKLELLLEEPHFAVMGAIDAIYAHLVRKASAKEMCAVCEKIAEALRVSRSRLLNRKWSVEKRIQATATCNALDVLLDEVKLPKGMRERLRNENELFRRAFYMPGVKKGMFEDSYPLLQKHAKRRKRRGYAELMKRLYDYPDAPDTMQRMAERWLEKELPLFRAVTKRLARLYGCRNTRLAVQEEIAKRWAVAQRDVVSKTKLLNRTILPLMNKYLIEVPPQHKSTIIETPSYLSVFLPTAAVQPFNTLTPKPFNLFFVTPGKRANLVDLLQLLVHEEYGHCVHYTLIALRAATAAEKMENSLHGPVTEGLSFQRELEFLLLAQHNPELRTALKKIIGSNKAVDEFILAFEFETRKWRVIRFLRAIYDVRLYMGRMAVPEFIEWAHRKTAIDRETLFNQTFRVGVPAGYLPGYSIFGMKLWRLQRKLRKRTVRDFNTFVASSGMPGQSMLLERLEKFVE